MMIAYQDADLIIKDYLMSDKETVRQSVALLADFEFVTPSS